MRLARAIARVKHEGQFRKQTGEPYFNHVQRVAERVAYDFRAMTIAYLHDIIEDTNMTAGDLRHVGFGWDIVDDVVGLSRTEGEDYFDFIERGIRDLTDEGLLVKLADLQDNLINPPGDLRVRYIKADIMIRAALRDRGVETPPMSETVREHLSQVS